MTPLGVGLLTVLSSRSTFPDNVLYLLFWVASFCAEFFLALLSFLADHYMLLDCWLCSHDGK